MNDVVTLEDKLYEDGTYRLHLMSNTPIDYALPPGVEGIRSRDAGTCVLKAEWRYRGPCHLIGWDDPVVLWALNAGERVSE